MRFFCFLVGVLLVHSPASSDDVLRQFRSPHAKDAVSKYHERLTFLDERMAEQIKVANEALRADLQVALKAAVESNEFEEVERLSSFLRQSDVTATTGKATAANSATPEAQHSRTDWLREKARLVQKITELEKQIEAQSDLQKQVAGNSYRINLYGVSQVWTFSKNGAVLVNGKTTATRWIAFGNEALICVGMDNGHVDFCRFSDEDEKLEMILVGDFKQSGTRHVGALIKK